MNRGLAVNVAHIRLGLYAVIPLTVACSVAGTSVGQSPKTIESVQPKAAISTIDATVKQSEEHQLLKMMLGKRELKSIKPENGKLNGRIECRSVAFGNFDAENSGAFELFIEDDLLFGGPQIALVSHGVYGYYPLRRKYSASWYTNFNAIAFQGLADVESNQKQLRFKIEHPLLKELNQATAPPRAFVYQITFVDPQTLNRQYIEVTGTGAEKTESVLLEVLAKKPAAEPKP